MKTSHDNPLKVISHGVLAGVASTMALTAIITAAQSWRSGGRADPNHAAQEAGVSAGEALSEGPELSPQMDRVTAVFAQKVATGLFGCSLTREQQYAAGTLWHLAYGGFWGMSYAVLKNSLRVPQVLLAPLHSLFIWGLGPGWLLPKMELMLPPSEQEPETLTQVLGVHEAYGILAALILHWIENRK